MKPLCASSRRQMRQRPNLRYTARGRPQRRQREWARVLYFGVRDWRTIFDFFAMNLLSGCCRLRGERLEPGRPAFAREGHALRVEQGERLGVGRGGCRDGDDEPAHLVDAVVVDLGED